MLDRTHCGFAAFECDPTTCDRRCFTAILIDLDANLAAAEADAAYHAREARLWLSAVLAVALAMFGLAASYGAALDRQQFNQEQR